MSDQDLYDGYAHDIAASHDIDPGATSTTTRDTYEGYAADDLDAADRYGSTDLGNSATGQLMDDLERWRDISNPLRPVRGDPDPREVADMEVQIPLLDSAVDRVLDAWAPPGSPIGAIRDELHWGVVNMLQAQSTKLHKAMRGAAMELRDMVNVTTGSEVGDQDILEKSQYTRTLYDRVDAFDRLHTAAAWHYRRTTGEAWRPLTRTSYNAAQYDHPGSISAGRAGAAAARAARRPVVFAGVGSRQTPNDVQALMSDIANELAGHGMVLRSGAARGADQAFERGADRAGGTKEIFIPEEGFQKRSSEERGVSADIPDRAFDIAAHHHPVWHRLDGSVRRLQARNVLQVLGPDCETPADIVICWTADGRDRGGTSQAIRIARAHNIPILNLGAYERLPTAAEVLGHVQRTVPHWRLPRALAAESAETATLPPARTVFPNAHHVLVVGDNDYPDRQAISNALDALHAKHPNLVVNGFHGTPIGEFANEWAELHGVRHQLVGIPRAGDVIDMEPAVLSGNVSSAADYERVLLPVARRQHAIRKLTPRGILAFGDHPYDTQPYHQIAADHQIPFWSFDRDGADIGYRAGDVPPPAAPVRATLPVYAGLGASNAPAAQRTLMTDIGHRLAQEDFLLRSGGGQGAEQAFENGARLADGEARIYLPSDGYRGRESGVDGATAEIPERAYQIAASHHDKWDTLTEATRRQYARNAVEILGEDLSTPADAVVCWTRDGKDTGATAQALALAREHNIPIINLGAPGAPQSAEEVVNALRGTIAPWEKTVELAAERTIASTDIDRPASRDPHHDPTSLSYANRSVNRLIEVLGPDGTQLSDYRASVAWGVVNVLHHHHERLHNAIKRQEEKPNTARSPGYPILKDRLAELKTLTAAAKRHYSEGLGLPPWSPRGYQGARAPSYAELEAKALLNLIDRNATEAHRPANARILVDGAERLALQDYDRVDSLLSRIRTEHLTNDGRDITIVHKITEDNVLRRWCANNGVHQETHHADFAHYGKQEAPKNRDREMVTAAPADRLLDIRTTGGKNYLRDHVEAHNRNAETTGERRIRVTRVNATRATAQTPEAYPRTETPAAETARTTENAEAPRVGMPRFEVWCHLHNGVIGSKSVTAPDADAARQAVLDADRELDQIASIEEVREISPSQFKDHYAARDVDAAAPERTPNATESARTTANDQTDGVAIPRFEVWCHLHTGDYLPTTVNAHTPEEAAAKVLAGDERNQIDSVGDVREIPLNQFKDRHKVNNADNIVALHPASTPLHFNARSREGAMLALSHPTPVHVDGIQWPSALHFYEAEKLGAVRDTRTEQLYHAIHHSRDPAEARARATGVPTVYDWTDRRAGVMAEAICHKFARETPAAQYLLNTGKRPLVHDPSWQDGRLTDDPFQDRNALGPMLEHCREELREGRGPTIDGLASAFPHLDISDPAEARAIDYLKGAELHDQSYKAWRSSFRGTDARVSEDHSARTAALSDALGRAARHFNANIERYEPYLAKLEITPEDLATRERALTIETSHERARNQQQEMGAVRR